MRKGVVGLVALILAAGMDLASAQSPEAQSRAAETPESGIPESPAPTSAVDAVSSSRASWLNDLVQLREGDIVTVIIDERTTARERVTRVGQEKRSLGAGFDASADGKAVVGATGFDSGLNSDSRDVGEANRQGDLAGVLSARVIGVGHDGTAEIEGRKTVSVDGREQIMTLHGYVRPQDVASDNIVLSARIAEVSISYEGKKIGSKKGIIGKILSLIWP